MPIQHRRTGPAPAPGADAVDFTAVGRILADAAVLVRARGELGERPTRDRRPRIRNAIARAADLAGFTTAERPVRDWAIRLAAMQINAVLGRGRHRDGLDVAACALTLDGFGLDVGTVGAVNTAADLVGQAAATAALIADAQPIPVHGHRLVTAYHLGPVRAADIEIDDIVAVAAAVDALTGDGPRTARVRDIRIRDGTRAFVLDLPARPLPLHEGEVTAGTGWCSEVWRPVPHLHHPWQPR
jgi:hypothetical protein